MTKVPLFLRPLTALTEEEEEEEEEEEAAEVAEIMRVLEAARDAAAAENHPGESSPPELDQVDSK